MQKLRHQFQTAICVSIESVMFTEMRKAHPLPAHSIVQKAYGKHKSLKVGPMRCHKGK